MVVALVMKMALSWDAIVAVVWISWHTSAVESSETRGIILLVIYIASTIRMPRTVSRGGEGRRH